MNLEISFWLTLVLVLLAALFYVLRRAMLRPGRQCPEGKGLFPECLFVVALTDAEVSVRAPSGVETRLAVRDLREIVVETNDSGPGGADVWWLLFSADGRDLRFPGGATGESAALRLFQTLPGFDNSALIEAMGSTSNRRYIVYRG